MPSGGAQQAGNRRWTADEDAVVRDCMAKGMMGKEIAPLLVGRSVNAILKRAWMLGCNPGPEVARQRFQAGAATLRAEGRSGQKKGCYRRPHTPEELARLRAAVKRAMADPVIRERHRQGSIKGQKNRDMVALGRKVSETKLAWCPRHLRDRYNWLWGPGKTRAPEARRIVMAEWLEQLRFAISGIAAAARSEIDRPKTAFEIQVERVRNGARLVPTFRRTLPTDAGRSLIGSSAAML